MDEVIRTGRQFAGGAEVPRPQQPWTIGPLCLIPQLPLTQESLDPMGVPCINL